MKKIAKKFISVFLALSIALQVAVSAYAEAGVNLSDAFSSDSDLLSPEEYTEEELRPYFNKEFEKRILPPIHQGKSIFLIIWVSFIT